jgi:hypothetical protein
MWAFQGKIGGEAMAIKDWSPTLIRVLWEIDLGALLILMAPYLFGGDYSVTVDNVGYGVSPVRLVAWWLVCSVPLFLVTWRRHKDNKCR